MSIELVRLSVYLCFGSIDVNNLDSSLIAFPRKVAAAGDIRCVNDTRVAIVVLLEIFDHFTDYVLREQLLLAIIQNVFPRNGPLDFAQIWL